MASRSFRLTATPAASIYTAVKWRHQAAPLAFFKIDNQLNVIVPLDGSTGAAGDGGDGPDGEASDPASGANDFMKDCVASEFCHLIELDDGRGGLFLVSAVETLGHTASEGIEHHTWHVVFPQ